MSRSRSGQLAAWTSAWLQGHIGPVEVVDAVTASDAPHQIEGPAQRLLDVLLTWRDATSAVRLVLPVAGDVRGLPGPVDFRAAALDVGEAVCGAGVGLVPYVVDHSPSSAPPTVVWQAFDIEPTPPDFQQLGDAQYDLTTTIRESASALSAANVAGSNNEVGDTLSAVRSAGDRLDLPPGFPPRAVALLAQAERLQAILELADQDPIGGAVDRSGIDARREALRPLATAVRRARLAGYNALAS